MNNARLKELLTNALEYITEITGSDSTEVLTSCIGITEEELTELK